MIDFWRCVEPIDNLFASIPLAGGNLVKSIVFVILIEQEGFHTIN